VGFEPTISASEWPQTYALDRAALAPALISLVNIINGVDYSFCNGEMYYTLCVSYGKKPIKIAFKRANLHVTGEV
jgi:hypothetical protein